MLVRYFIKRIFIAIPTLLIISFFLFMVIQLPPGSYLDFRIAEMQLEGEVNWAEIENLRQQYHFDEPVIIQYFHWLGNFITGDWGRSFATDEPVLNLMGEYLPITVTISIFTILFTWAIAIPFGVIAAIKRNTKWDYALTFFGLSAMATPGFVVALVFQVVLIQFFPDFTPTGLVSDKYANEPLSLAKIGDVLLHLLIPIFILGVGGTAGMIRILRANLIDELRKQYVLASRARGLHPALVVLRYPFRVAINPMVSSVGLILPQVISGSVIVSIVLSLPTLGPLLFTALQSQDTYLAVSVTFVQCILAVVGILISDILLALVDPRIKFGAKS